MRVRLDYTTKQGRCYEEFYTLLPLDANGRCAKLDTKMEWLRRQKIEAIAYALDAQDQIDKKSGYDGVVGAANEASPRWVRWRENGLI